MTFTYEFHTDEEKESIINSHTDLILIKEQHITEGKFLIFTDIPPVENQLQDIKNNTDILVLKGEGII